LIREMTSYPEARAGTKAGIGRKTKAELCTGMWLTTHDQTISSSMGEDSGGEKIKKEGCFPIKGIFYMFSGLMGQGEER